MRSETTTQTDVNRGLGESFWTLANLVCAFAVVQMIAYMMAASDRQGHIATGVQNHRPWVVLAIVVATLIYGCALHYFARCHWKLLKLNAGDAHSMLRMTSFIRIAAVVAINVVGVLVTCDIGSP